MVLGKELGILDIVMVSNKHICGCDISHHSYKLVRLIESQREDLFMGVEQVTQNYNKVWFLPIGQLLDPIHEDFNFSNIFYPEMGITDTDNFHFILSTRRYFFQF
jgi:hypothetical protein